VLTRLELANFKCFELLKLPLAPLTLLSGGNASGKSSVLQALVLLHQTIHEQEWSHRLLLNGAEVGLGTVTDVVDKVTGRKGFGIYIADNDRSVRWIFEVENRRDLSAAVLMITTDKSTYRTPEELHFLLPPTELPGYLEFANRLARLTYLTAERVGPRDVYSLQDPNVNHFVGPRGEFAVSLLHWRRDDKVLDALAFPDTPPTCLRQVEAWMKDFFPGCGLEIQQVQQANACTLGLRTSEATDFHRPIHIGFGLTQVLPIIVAAVTAKPDDILLIENPEVHLHPAGQAKMGLFLSSVARAGIQIVLETHSDHVLNGVRRGVRNRILSTDDVALHFFRRRDDDGEQVVSPIMDANGNIDKWPSGFFDQFDKDANYFAGWGE
jgi:predicted ATPase